MCFKNLIIFLILILSTRCFSQWTTLNIPSGLRYDDVFFINDTVGWAAGGNSTEILKTTNGGTSWTHQYTAGKYLRSIVFATPTLGFCGSLYSSFYKTTDGGNSWIDIADSIIPKPPGICGLSAPTQSVIYGCGIWSSPAYIIKSTDGGTTWRTINLCSLAHALVDIHFINADTGFVCGMANPETDGGIILFTTDGGNTWTVKHKTLTYQDYIWKIQTPDNLHFYGSIEGLPVTGNVRMVQSNDGGMTWTTSTIKNTYSYIQTIGFINPMKGWTGGGSTLFETTDGGLTWDSVTLGSAYNRFFKINDTTAFLSGKHIYKYQSKNLTTTIDTKPFDEIHTLNVSSNPAYNIVKIEMNIKNRTYCKLQLFSSNGILVRSVYDGPIESGVWNYSVSTINITSQVLYLILRTNEGLIYKKIIKV